jgi:general stress protein 26
MMTLSAIKHQELMEKKWRDACEKWTPGSGGFPNLSMYGFNKKYGYVTFDKRGAYWRRTKKESIEAFQKRRGIL